MDVELYSLLSIVIAAVTVLTVVFAAAAYLVFRWRETSSARQAITRQQSLQPSAPRFFRRYEPAAQSEIPNAEKA